MTVAGSQAVLPGRAAVRAVPPKWRLLRLSESVQAGVWARNTTYVRVLSSTQDAAGWITLTLQNPTPASDTPDEMAYLTWVFKDVYGRTVVPGGGAGGLSGLPEFHLERDPTTWPGAASETIGLGLCDNAGDAETPNAQLLAIGIRTPSAAATYTLIAGNAKTASADTGVTGTAVVGRATTTPTQSVALVAGGLTTDNTAVAGGFATNVPPLAATGERVVWLGAGCASTGAGGPYTVRFRAHYRVLPAPDMPT